MEAVCPIQQTYPQWGSQTTTMPENENQNCEAEGLLRFCFLNTESEGSAHETCG